MSRQGLLLAIDQGTSSTRAIAFDRDLRPVAVAARPLAPVLPKPGWVEYDAAAILDSVVDVVAEVVAAVGGVDHIEATGLDNQGETVVAWEAESLEPFGPAISWQCRRSQSIVDRIREAGHDAWIRARTGLTLDPYYSASKMTWLLENVEIVRTARDRGTLRFGTVDAWLSAKLGGEALSDPSTASRTQLAALSTLDWDPELLSVFGVLRPVLPRIVATAGGLGELRHPRWGGSLRLTAMACDQQAALAGHGGFSAGAIKATYGTGVFVLANAGDRPSLVDGIETSVGWVLPDRPTSYVLQGGVLAGGALMDWLNSLFGQSSSDRYPDVAALAGTATGEAAVRVLPGLYGLGAPWFRPEVRGVIAGITPDTRRADVERAALRGIAQRVADVVEAMLPGLDAAPAALRVDGGLSANDYLMQCQADVLGLPVEVAAGESTALGIAGLAGIGAGVLDEGAIAKANPCVRRFEPQLTDAVRTEEREAWRRFVEAASTLPV